MTVPSAEQPIPVAASPVPGLPEAPAAPAPLVPATPGAKHRVDLGGGEWADVRDPDDLRAGHRKQVIRQLDEGQTIGAMAVNVGDAIAAVMVLGWSLALPLPSLDLSSLDELTFGQEKALQAHPAMQEALARLRPAGDPTEPNQDPASPTGASSGSAAG